MYDRNLPAGFHPPVPPNSRQPPADERTVMFHRAMCGPVKGSLRFHCPAVYDVLATLAAGRPVLAREAARKGLQPEHLLLLDNSWLLAAPPLRGPQRNTVATV